MPKLDNETLLLAFVAVTALAFLLQTLILFLIFVTLKKSAKAVHEEVEDLRSAIMPIIYNTREFYSRFSELYARVAPRVEDAANDLAEITSGLRVQSTRMQASVIDVVDRVRQQSARIDDMFTGVLDAVDRAGGFIAEVVSKPIRQVQAMLASVKAAIESLSQTAAEAGEPAAPAPAEGQPTHSAFYGPDQENFS